MSEFFFSERFVIIQLSFIDSSVQSFFSFVSLVIFVPSQVCVSFYRQTESVAMHPSDFIFHQFRYIRHLLLSSFCSYRFLIFPFSLLSF